MHCFFWQLSKKKRAYGTIHKLIIIYYYLNLHKPINLLYNLQQKYRQHSRTNLFRQHWNNHFNSLFLALALRTRLHYSFFLMSASEVESEGLGNFFWCPWEFGFKRMQHPSSILPWWLCTVIHIKTLPVSSEKCSAHPSKWKCISITAALFLPLHSICLPFNSFGLAVFFRSSWPLQLIFIKTKLLTLLIHATLQVELATRVLPEPWFASLHENTWNQYFYFGFKAIFLWPYRCLWVQACKVSPKIKSFYTLSALHHLDNLEKKKKTVMFLIYYPLDLELLELYDIKDLFQKLIAFTQPLIQCFQVTFSLSLLSVWRGKSV